MLDPALSRKYLNPFLLLSGAIVLISGIFLLLHIKSTVIKEMHQIGSYFFVVCSVWHITLNRKALLKTLGGNKPASIVAMLILAATLAMAFSEKRPSKPKPDVPEVVQVAPTPAQATQ